MVGEQNAYPLPVQKLGDHPPFPFLIDLDNVPQSTLFSVGGTYNGWRLTVNESKAPVREHSHHTGRPVAEGDA